MTTYLGCVINPRSSSVIINIRLYFKAPRKPCQLVLQLPNQFLNRMDKLARPACLHPTNPHSIMLTSEQGLVLLDERFLRSPLITINHYMRDHPQFMCTLSDEVDSALRTMAFLGGRRYQDTRCLEFEQRCVKSTKLYSKISEQDFITQPPVCTQMPWKVLVHDLLIGVTCDIFSPQSRGVVIGGAGDASTQCLAFLHFYCISPVLVSLLLLIKLKESLRYR